MSIFSIDYIDGCRIGKLSVPVTDIADWLNFLATPHYRATIMFADQEIHVIHLYFHGSEGLYMYLDRRLNIVDTLPVAG